MFKNRKIKKRQPKLGNPNGCLDFQNMDCIYSERGFTTLLSWANFKGFKERGSNPDTYFVVELVAFGFTQNNLIIKLKHDDQGHCENWFMWTNFWEGHSFRDIKDKMLELCNCTNGKDNEVQYNFHCGDDKYTYNINAEDDLVGIEK